MLYIFDLHAISNEAQAVKAMKNLIVEAVVANNKRKRAFQAQRSVDFKLSQLETLCLIRDWSQPLEVLARAQARVEANSADNAVKSYNLR